MTRSINQVMIVSWKNVLMKHSPVASCCTMGWNNLWRSILYFPMHIAWFFDCLAHPNRSATFATEKKLPNCLHISYSRVWNRHSPWNKRSPPPHKNSFLHQSRHCGHFFFFLLFFSKINKRTPKFIPDSIVPKFSRVPFTIVLWLMAFC